MRRFFNLAIRIVDPLLAFLALLMGPVLHFISRARARTPLSRLVLDFFKVSLVPHHYYEPVLRERDLLHPLDAVRQLPGINLRIEDQLELMSRLNYADELRALPIEKPSENKFGYHNGSYESGDAELLYDFVRYFKPRRIIEVGCGNSTLVIREAIAKNLAGEANYNCEHVCIEPFEQPWLEDLDIQIIRERVELCSLQLFSDLGENDILFIDSSHVTRPQGDVVHLFLRVLPTLKPGVLVHVHDVFTPRDYLAGLVVQDRRMWNEQYILEALLSCSSRFRVVAALNLLSTDHRKILKDACPILYQEPERSPGAFWFRVDQYDKGSHPTEDENQTEKPVVC
jgi:hypothetical protein